MKYCKDEGLRYPDSAVKCRSCGEPLVEASPVGDRHDNVAFSLATLSCANPSCRSLVATPKTNFCAMCGIELKPISYEVWIDKFVLPALETRLAEVVLDPSDLFPPIAQLGLARSQARTILDSLLTERTGVKPQVLERWTKKAVSLLNDAPQREAAMQEAIRESKKLKIAPAHANAILEVLNQRVELPSAFVGSAVHSYLEAKPRTSEPESFKASAKSFYRRLVAGSSVTKTLTYLDFKKSASRVGLRNSDEFLKEVSSEGAFILFVCGDDRGWVFPNPKLDFNPDFLNTLFTTLTADQFNNFKEHIEPVPVIQVGRSRWRVERTENKPHDNQSNKASTVESKAPQPEETPIVFPVSAADCLAKTETSSKVVRHDIERNLLVTGPKGKGEISLIRNPLSKKSDSFLAIPRITSFKSAATFHNLYKRYYFCDRPSAGEVWVIKPAVVSKGQEGWHLFEKGRLEIDFVATQSPVLYRKPDAAETKQTEGSKIFHGSIHEASVRESFKEPFEESPKEIPVAGPLLERRIRLSVAIVVSLILLGAIAVGIYQRPSRSVEYYSATPTPTPTNMIRVPGGEFQMGTNAGDAYEKPAHPVIVKPFLIDAYEVTCEEYLKFVKATNHRAPSNWIGGQYPTGAAKKPITGVDWDDATAYASWAKKRLPTEQEWEFAARGIDGRRYPWGNEWRLDAANADGASEGLKDVGTYTSGASPFGVFDMVGNAWEWTAGKLAPYPGGKLGHDASNDLRVLRGGSWGSDKQSATTTYRFGWPARGGKDYRNTSFRCAQDP